MTARTALPFVVGFDTREQMEWVFPEYVQTERITVPVGDYTIVGYEREIAIERKALGDFVSCVTCERPRFMRELEKLREYDFACVIIEADIGDVWNRAYRSDASPAAIIGSAAAFTIDYVPVIFGGDPQRAADLALRFLSRWHKRRLARTEAAS